MVSPIITPGGLNLALNPLSLKEGDLIRAINVTLDQFGAKKKRPGYTTYLGTPDNAEVTTLFNFTKDSGTQLWNYRFSGSVLYYSAQGTGDWTTCGNGTFAGGGTIGHAITENTMLIGNGVDATRHTTNGTAFTDTSSAPIAAHFVDYQNRIYAGGTASSLFWSTAGTPTDWITDSSSIQIPGPGKINSVIKVGDRINISKNSGGMYRCNLFDLATNLGPTSASSIGNVEDFRFYFNNTGVYGFGGNKPEIISNPIEKQIYNDAGSGIIGTTFPNIQAVVHRYEYIATLGSVTDDLTDELIENAIGVYDYQADEWFNWKFANKPTAYLSYKDALGDQQLIFGDSGGQCYTYGGTNTSDNGQTIEVVMEGILHGGTLKLKKWSWIRFLFNPACEASVLIAPSNTFTKQNKQWINLGQAINGIVEFKIPAGTRSRLMYYKIIEASRQTRMNWYAMEYDADLDDNK